MQAHSPTGESPEPRRKADVPIRKMSLAQEQQFAEAFEGSLIKRVLPSPPPQLLNSSTPQPGSVRRMARGVAAVRSQPCRLGLPRRKRLPSPFLSICVPLEPQPLSNHFDPHVRSDSPHCSPSPFSLLHGERLDQRGSYRGWSLALSCRREFEFTPYPQENSQRSILDLIILLRGSSSRGV